MNARGGRTSKSQTIYTPFSPPLASGGKTMIDYENLIIEREEREYPIGLKHYSTETILENSLLDVDLIGHKLKNIFGGNDNEQGNEGEVR